MVVLARLPFGGTPLAFVVTSLLEVIHPLLLLKQQVLSAVTYRTEPYRAVTATFIFISTPNVAATRNRTGTSRCSLFRALTDREPGVCFSAKFVTIYDLWLHDLNRESCF